MPVNTLTVRGPGRVLDMATCSATEEGRSLLILKRQFVSEPLSLDFISSVQSPMDSAWPPPILCSRCLPNE